jgi:hypothetical protein
MRARARVKGSAEELERLGETAEFRAEVERLALARYCQRSGS